MPSGAGPLLCDTVKLPEHPVRPPVPLPRRKAGGSTTAKVVGTVKTRAGMGQSAAKRVGHSVTRAVQRLDGGGLQTHVSALRV